MELKDKVQKIFSSPILWGETFCKVIDKRGKKVKFILNPQQRELVNNLEKYNIVLKSRQLGITTVSCCLSLYYAITKPSSHCMLVSYSADSASTIFDKLKQMYDDLPNGIKPLELANNRSCLKFSNGSKITVCTMGSKELARGASLTFVHISEVAFCKEDKVIKQLLAIEQALLPDGKIVLESTANGMNDFYNLWNKAENKESLYKPFFFSWIDDKLMFSLEYKEFAKRYKALHNGTLTIDELTEDEQLYYGMGATLEQLMWRRLKIANSSEEKFKQEFPSTPLEAFITTGNNVFNSEKVSKEYIERSKTKPLAVVPNIPIELKSYLNNYFSVWEAPKRGVKYYIGVDASEGVGQDYTVIDVYDQDALQVAQFRTNKLQPYLIAEILNNIGKWYNKALLVIEKASGGHIILDRMRNTFKYMNIYKHIDYDQRGKKVKKIGWITSSKTKPILIQDFVECWENNEMFINSVSTLNEMKTYLYSDGTANGETGTHDDCVIASALALQGIKNGVNYLW